MRCRTALATVLAGSCLGTCRSIAVRAPHSAQVMQGLRKRIDACNDVSSIGELTPLVIGGEVAGEVRKEVAKALISCSDVFVGRDSIITLTDQLDKASTDERSAAFADVASSLHSRGMVKTWRNELLAVTTRFDGEPALVVERGCIPLLGAKGYGVAVCGYTCCPKSSEQFIWVARRALDKPTWPGMLDVLAAGAISAGMSVADTACKEAAEEAGVPEALAVEARPAGAISYRGCDEWGQLKRDVFFTCDLELPWDFEPTPVDGEVAGFERVAVESLVTTIATGHPIPFKPNINLIMIDFLIRHGHISPSAPGYLDLLASLRLGDCK